MAEAPTLLANRFRIDSLIAEGGMAKVYKGTDLLLGRTVAIKVLAANLARDPAFVVRFRREARAAASLSHNNVVSVFDTGSDGDHHYIVMEYIEGETLADVIAREAPMDPVRTASIASTVCEALAVAHTAGIVHRDVKPANVLINTAGRVKVMDFGIAKTALDGLTQAGSVLGTVAYLSPEQAAGEAVDRRSDLYSLGCMIFEMLTGRPPISGDSLIDMATKLSTHTPPPPSALNPNVPPQLDALVAKAIAKAPEQRYQDAPAMQRALESFVAGRAFASEQPEQTMVAPVTGASQDRTRVLPAPPARRLNPALLVAGLLLVGAGLYATFNRSNLAPSPSETEVTTAPAEVSPAPTEPSPTPPASPSPAPSPQPSPTARNRAEAFQAVIGVQNALNAGIAQGEVTDDAALDVIKEVERAFNQYDDGDVDDAVRDVGDARDEVAKHLEDQEISPRFAATIEGALDRLERTFLA